MAETKGDDNITESEVIERYQRMQNQCQAFANKIAEFEADLAEHEYVHNIRLDNQPSTHAHTHRKR